MRWRGKKGGKAIMGRAQIFHKQNVFLYYLYKHKLMLKVNLLILDGLEIVVEDLFPHI